MSWKHLAARLATSLVLVAPAHAVTPGYVDNFTAPGVAGWDGGSALSNPLTGGVGGAADGYLRLHEPFSAHFGAKSSNPNYQGNWTDAGIAQVRFFLNDVAADDVFQMHFLITSLIDASTTWQYNPAWDPPRGQWQQHTVDVSSSANWTRIRGTGTFQNTLAAVDRIHFRHDLPPFTASSDSVAGDLGIDQLTILKAQWYATGSGNWSDAANWVGPVPDVADAAANLLGRPTVPATLSLTGPITVGTLTFDNLNTYTIAGGSTLTLRSAANASISLAKGAHVISAPLQVDSNTTISGDGSLTTGNITNAAAMAIQCTVAANDLDGAGTAAVGTGGVLRARHIRLSALALEAGSTVSVEPGGGDAGASVLNSLTIAGSTDAWLGTLDLADNILVIHASPETRDQVFADAYNQIKTARNAPSDLWTGPGITSSSAAADPRHMTALGIMLNDPGSGRPIAASIHGLPLTANDIMIRYTWLGDANLDGLVNADDYFRIDSNYIPQKPGWYNGDFNYDSVVNADDYFLIDSAFLGQTAPLASLAPPPNVAVPEPAVAALLAAALLTLRSRRASSPSP